jgi:dTDP-4-amino-4,6-dideoxygalactose transaminase
MAIKFCSVIAPDFEMLEYYISLALQNGKMSNFGVLHDMFSKKLHEFLHLPPDKEVVLTSSGHVALLASYACLGATGVLAIPAYTFESTRAAATLQGLPIHLVDVDESTGAPRISALDPTKFDTLVIVTPLSSIPNLREYEYFCKTHGKKLIVDGAASFGTLRRDENMDYCEYPDDMFSYESPCIYGDAYCLSFHATKSFPVGEAGAVICDHTLAAKIKSYINFGFDDHHAPVMAGLNGKVSEYTCAVGLSLFSKATILLECRQRNVARILERLKDYPTITTLESYFGEDTIYQSFPLFMDRSDEVIKSLAAAEIDSLKYYRPLSYNKSQFPIANRLYERNVCLPVHHLISECSIDRMMDVVLQFV